jgi:hypothetical protein
MEYFVEIIPARRRKGKFEDGSEVPFKRAEDLPVLPRSDNEVYLEAAMKRVRVEGAESTGDQPQDGEASALATAEPKHLNLERGSTKRSRYILKKLEERILLDLSLRENRICFVVRHVLLALLMYLLYSAPLKTKLFLLLD